MLQKVYSAAVIGLSAEPIEVETDISSGLPATIVVGLPDAAIREARERVKSALKHANMQFPKSRVAINLAPADLPKIGSHYDLPIAISILLNSGQVRFDPADKVFVGELALDGILRPVPGVLVIAEAAAKRGFKTLFVPEANAPEASLIKGLEVVKVKSLTSLLQMLDGITPFAYFEKSETQSAEEPVDENWDFRLVRGQELAKRALEIAASGGHNILMAGSPGSGKTLLARALPSILPSLTYQESLEVTKIYSVAGLLASRLGLLKVRPFRSPHHTASGVALVGGGSDPRPGEITLAHCGICFWMSSRNLAGMFWKVCGSHSRMDLSMSREPRAAFCSRPNSCWWQRKTPARAGSAAMRKKRAFVRPPSFCDTRGKFPDPCLIELICMSRCRGCLLRKSKMSGNWRIQRLSARGWWQRGSGKPNGLPKPGF